MHSAVDARARWPSVEHVKRASTGVVVIVVVADVVAVVVGVVRSRSHCDPPKFSGHRQI